MKTREFFSQSGTRFVGALMFALCLATLPASAAATLRNAARIVAVPHESGTASYYADKYHGKPTASGEIFDMYQLTAAHPSLKFGTIVKVTNITNHRSVIVRINDRGPFVGKRVIDLSLAAAQELQMVQSGLAPVTIEVLPR